MKMIIFKCFLISLSAIYINCESQCSNFETCGGCTTFPKEKCVWCSAKKLPERRCQSLSFYETNKSWCNESIYNPWVHIEPNITQNDELTSGIKGEGIVQFKPQYMTIKARPGVVVNFSMEYQPAQDYPLDVYYLMDFSDTMSQHKHELQTQSMLMRDELTNLTNNVQFGVGSFVEKPELPFASPRRYSYSFKNHLPLTTQMKTFSEKIKNSLFGANLDDPEAGFDALMQAMVCQNEVGWRNASRRIIVFCTDSTYHSAGDGKFVGAYKHNDMKCHLDEYGNYTEALSLDYPSVSQINKISTDKNIIIIFAVKKTVRREYKALERKIINAKYSELKQESNIVEIIRKAYLEMVGHVKIKRVVPSDIQLILDPDCSIGDGCKAKHREAVKINGFLKLQSCPSDKKRFDFVRIGPVGLEEELVIRVDMDCQCDCEKPGVGEINSTLCSGGGIYQCGVCKCNGDRYGSNCQCTGMSTDKIDLDKCKINKDDAVYCSGHGICRCGKCEECEDGTYGDFCEFDDNNDCPRPEGKPCMGNGRCHYGRCECDDGWTGDDCTCPSHNRDCIAVYSKEICTGNGICKCGKCVCNKLDSSNETYSGAYCDSCKECANKRCKELEAYVYCVYMNDKKSCDIQFNETSESIVLMLNKTEINDPKYKLAKWCRKELDDGSFIVFRYDYKDTLVLLIQKEKELPPKANVWIVVGSAIGVILLIGLLTLLAWKILVDLHDAREYKKFSEESAAAGFDVSLNPLYQAPAINFSNPTYDYNNRS